MSISASHGESRNLSGPMHTREQQGEIDSDATTESIDEVRKVVETCVKELQVQWGKEPEWKGFFENKRLAHEIEETVAPIFHLSQFPPLVSGHNGAEDFTLVDLCAGKGYMAVVTAALAERGVIPGISHIRRIVMVEKCTHAEICWKHVQRFNKAQGVKIEVWAGENLHDQRLGQRLRHLPGKLLVVGIHLCRRLSSRCVELFNQVRVM